MKLPTDKKERNKVLMLVGVGAAAVLYVLFQVISGTVRSRSKAIDTIAELDTKLKESRRDIAEGKNDREKNEDILAALQAKSNRHFLHPGLGKNYLLGVTATLEQMSARTGVPIQSITERGLLTVPNPEMPNLLKTYSVGIYLLCGYEDALRLVKEIENSNPLVCVSDLDITGNAGRDPENHTIRFDVLWLTWGDESVRDRIESFEPRATRSEEDAS